MGNKLKPSDMGLILSVDQCIEMASGTLECASSKMKLARSAYSKNSAKQTIEFFQSIVYHLNKLKDK
ncbi:MAG: hypothetical protein LBG45_02680 [Dysgonamonadaceae bacterium]|jgi:hypothetical protein|nr:hypothetical protein [Dysgonamonadaceae bacterium]